MKKFMEVNGIEVAGNKEQGDNSELPGFLSDNHILFEKNR
jgi:hypothetical protein